MDKKALSESDICAKCITPALAQAGWDETTQIRREVSFTKGRIIVRGKLVTRSKGKRADYILYYKHIPIAVVEAKDNNHALGDGMQQALDYATTLDIPFVFASNGDGFLFHDCTGISPQLETNLTLNEFPSPATLWGQYRAWIGLETEQEKIILQPYYEDSSGKEPRYYQRIAINTAVIKELAEEGLLLDPLMEEVGKDLDPFDLICHIAFDQTPLTRRERAENVRKRDVFTKYGPQTRAVLEALLQKYQDEGVVTDLDDPHILQIAPFDGMGTTFQLIKQFGTRSDFERAVHQLQSALYEEAA